jgi:pimeloyl-ACP methyl ester carboxylesterase
MKKKKDKSFLFKSLPVLFGILEKISPNLSGKLALFLFMRPPRFKRPPRELPNYDKAIKSFIQVEDYSVAVYEWGEGPIVWIMHGWAGRASQFFAITEFLVKEGFKIIGIDAPGHGDTNGSTSNILLFEQSLQGLQKKYGKPYAFIGHSLGGASGFYAMKNGIQFDKYVSISAPILPELILHESFDKIGAKQITIDTMCNRIYKEIGIHFKDLTASTWAKEALTIPYLIIHDKDDKEASIEHARELQKLIPSSKLHETNDLGHIRIIRNHEIIKEITRFLNP